MPSQLPQDGANNVVDITANYRRTRTGSQLGTPQLQPLLIKTYNENWGTITADPLNPNIKTSDPNTIFSRIIRAVQDYAEVYFIGNPQVAAGGESNVTECVVWVNVNTHTNGHELSSGDGTNEGNRWLDLEAHIQASIPTSDSVYVYYAVQDGWIWRVANFIPTTGNYGGGWFPTIAVSY